MGLKTRELTQHIKLGDHSDSLINFSYYPQSDRASVQIKQIHDDQLIMMSLGDSEIRSLIAIYQKLKFTREIQKNKFKTWNSWVLDEEEIMNIAEGMGLDYQIQVQEHIDEIAEKFRSRLCLVEGDHWEDMVKDSIKEVLEIEREIDNDKPK